MMSVVVVDAEAGTQASSLRDALNAMAAICDQSAEIIEGVTMPGGGLESAQLKGALQGRMSEITELAASLRTIAESVSSETAAYLTEIDQIDDFVY